MTQDNIVHVTDKNPEQIRTVTTDLLKINHPIMLAGMNVAAGPKLAAAVSNAGGLGVIGGVGYTPDSALFLEFCHISEPP